MKGQAIILGLAAATLSTASLAAQPGRALPVPPGKGWQHADTGLILTATLDGLERTGLVDATQSERDVVAEFGSSSAPTSVTIELFHPSAGNVAMWFDRADTVERAGGVVPVSDATAFAPPAATISGALRRTYRPGRGQTGGTALAVIPLRDWIVSVRVRATSAGAAATGAQLSRVIAAIRWPADVPPPIAVHPVERCATSLVFTDAKRIEPDRSRLLLTAAITGIDGDATASGPSVATGGDWCRDGTPNVVYATYRAGAATSGYTIALGRAGRTISVTPVRSTTGSGASTIGVTYASVTGSSSTYPSFDAVPTPQSVVEEVDASTAGDR